MASLLPSPITCDKAQGLHLRVENKGLVCKLEFKAGLQGALEGWYCFSIHPIMTVCIWWLVLPWPCKAMSRGEEIIWKTLMPVLLLYSSFSDYSHSLWKWRKPTWPKGWGIFSGGQPQHWICLQPIWTCASSVSPVTKSRWCCCPASGGWSSGALLCSTP